MFLKKYLILLVLSLLISSNDSFAQINFGAFELDAVYKGDFAYNFNGGNKQGFAYLGNIDLIVDYDTEKGGLWKGGVLHSYFLNNHGSSISSIVGDVQGVDNIEAPSATKVYELWYSQQIGNFNFLFGQHDLNSVFSVTENAGGFMNSSFGMQPDISANAPVSIFPNASIGFVIKWDILDNLTLLSAGYSCINPSDNSDFIHWKVNSSDGLFGIFEMQYRFMQNNNTKAELKVGFWNHKLGEDDIKNDYKYNQGYYLSLDYSIFRENSSTSQGLNSFIQLGYAPKEENMLTLYASLGVVYEGLFVGRDEDVLGLAVAMPYFSDTFRAYPEHKYLKNERTVEVFYKAKFGNHITVQPDLQYVINPAGIDVNFEDAFVGFVRVTVNL